MLARWMLGVSWSPIAILKRSHAIKTRAKHLKLCWRRGFQKEKSALTVYARWDSVKVYSLLHNLVKESGVNEYLAQPEEQRSIKARLQGWVANVLRPPTHLLNCLKALQRRSKTL